MKNKICCKAMESRIKPEGCSGITMMELMDKDFKLKSVLTVYKMTARDRGLVMNYCPWCGKEQEKP